VTVIRAAEERAPAASGRNAGFATRLLAFAADAVVIDLVIWLVGGAVAVVASALGTSRTADTVLLAVGTAVGAMWTAGYFVFFWSTTGQTPGNRLMRIRVRDAREDRPLGIGHAVLRVLGGVLSLLLLGLGFLLILVESRRRGLHDLIGRSIVVYLPRSARARGAAAPG
jgi:uncharacterized RDD family membrane protein YckC